MHAIQDLIHTDPLRLQGQAAICDIHVTNSIIYTVSRAVTNNATLREQHKVLIGKKKLILNPESGT